MHAVFLRHSAHVIHRDSLQLHQLNSSVGPHSDKERHFTRFILSVQLLVLFLEIISGHGSVLENKPMGTRVHFLKPNYHYAFAAARRYSLPRHVNGCSAGAAIVVNVENGNSCSTQLIGRTLPTRRVSVHMARVHLLYMLPVK